MHAWNQLLFQNGAPCSHPLWLGCEVNIVDESEKAVRAELARHCLQCFMLTQCEKSGINASPCSPRSPCGIRWTVPSSFGHINSEGDP